MNYGWKCQKLQQDTDSVFRLTLTTSTVLPEKCPCVRVCPVFGWPSTATALRHEASNSPPAFAIPLHPTRVALQPIQGLTKILRALTFAGHLAHPHQSVEVALCSICDTWKHGSIGHQIKGAELKLSLVQLCNPPPQLPPKERQGWPWEI